MAPAAAVVDARREVPQPELVVGRCVAWRVPELRAPLCGRLALLGAALGIGIARVAAAGAGAARWLASIVAGACVGGTVFEQQHAAAAADAVPVAAVAAVPRESERVAAAVVAVGRRRIAAAAVVAVGHTSTNKHTRKMSAENEQGLTVSDIPYGTQKIKLD